MLVEYSVISEDAKVWIYPSSRKFYANEIDEIQEKITTFLNYWKSESDAFQSSYQLLYNRFIILFADDSESKLTLKDIDDSVAFILQLQQEYKVELLDKMNVCFKQGEFVQYKELKDFKTLLKNRAITGKTIVFDNLVSNKIDFEEVWEIPIEESWYNRFLK